MSGTTTKPFNIGRDASAVLLWNGTKINLPRVTNFESSQQVRNLDSMPMNSVPTFINVPNGWQGQFDTDRASSDLDALIAASEAAFWSAGTVGQGTIYLYVSEADGSTTTWEFTGVAIHLSDAGRWQSEAKVSQRIQFRASQRTQIS